MSDTSRLGVLYTEYCRLKAATPIASLWSYETRSREPDRRSVSVSPDGSQEYWLDRSDPLLNTILPGTGVSLIVNVGDMWAAGRSLAASALLPRVCVAGPVTQARILRLGRSVHAIGAGFMPTLAPAVFNVPASELVDQIVPLDDLWTREEVERLLVSLAYVVSGRTRDCVSALKDRLVARIGRANDREPITYTASRLITLRGGRISIDEMARREGLSRQRFSARFSAAAGLPPKLFARITRFQALVHALLSTDVSQWASMSSEVGFYDQSHMINEFRALAGSPPTVFFQPHGNTDRAGVQLRGRPSEWSLPPERHELAQSRFAEVESSPY